MFHANHVSLIRAESFVAITLPDPQQNFSGKKPAPIDLDGLCERAPYITDISGFLKEKSEATLLKYWLDEYHPNDRFHTLDDIWLALDRDIAEIDHLINDQLNAIIHHPRFQKLEASWRGLWYLASQAEGIKNLKIKVLDISWQEVVRDLDRAMEFDHSQLFNKVYNDEYGIPGGEPYGVLIGDYEISHRPSKNHPYDDMTTLKRLCEIAAAAFAPFIANASPEMFGLDDFSSLGSPLNLDTIFKQSEYIKWQAIRESADSRFVGLALPKILMRLPYRTTPGSHKNIFFYEKFTKNSPHNYLWGNACFAFGAVLIREFGSVGWFGHIRGVPRNHIGGGLLVNLPVDSFATDAGEVGHKPSTDVIITDSRERELSSLGFTPLCQCYDTPFAAFFSNQSIQKPGFQNSDSLTHSVNAKLSSMLQHVLCGSRIAHYVKVIIRDKIGSYISAEECEDVLQNWLYRYTSGREDMEWEEQARYPLREARVQVKEHPEKPGQYLCTIRLVPHYQVDNMISEMELVTELVQSK